MELFMVGTPERPGTLHSALACKVLRACGVPFLSRDVSDETLATAARTLSGFEFFPQLFIAGEFIGGTEMVVELAKSGQFSGAGAQRGR